MSEPTLQDCINYMRSQIKQMEKYPRNYEFNLPYYRKTVELLEDERPHGEWKHDPNGWFCSACDHGWEYVKTPSDFLSFNFCPNCGASMRKEGESSDKTPDNR